MCGRFVLKETPTQLAEYFHLASVVDFAPAWNIAPSAQICSIAFDGVVGRHLRKMRWGLIPSWTTDATSGSKLSNARGETVADKPSFRFAFKHRRCIIPASGFYEWATVNGVKQPWYISLKSGDPIAFAGLWETWRPQEGETIESCCIITTSANTLMAPIHDRMPVILPPDKWEEWLCPTERQTDKLLLLLQPHEAEPMQAWHVTRELNKVDLRNDAGLIEPIESSKS